MSEDIEFIDFKKEISQKMNAFFYKLQSDKIKFSILLTQCTIHTWSVISAYGSLDYPCVFMMDNYCALHTLSFLPHVFYFYFYSY